MSDDLCPVLSCQKKRKRGHMMCARHWRCLPDDITDQFQRDLAELQEARRENTGVEDEQARAVLAETAALEQRARCVEAARFARWGHHYVPRELRGRTFREETNNVDR